MHRDYLLKLLAAHRGMDDTEENMRLRMITFIRAHPDCFERSLTIGHITGSAWLINPARTRVFMLHHAKLNRWLQPGGHSDGDANTLRVALREAHEESGIALDQIKPLSDTIFDVDIHTIPARKSEPEHEHFDVRFLLEADDSIALHSNDESHEVAWIPLEEVNARNGEASVMRMVAKTRALSV